jgi:superfamily II DNA or RNA helicase
MSARSIVLEVFYEAPEQKIRESGGLKGRRAATWQGCSPSIELIPGEIGQSSSTKNGIPTQALVLRDYQAQGLIKAKDEYRLGARRVVYVAPTGSGKGVLIAHVACSAARSAKRTLIVAPSIEIVRQSAAAIDRCGVRFGIIAAGVSCDESAPIQIATVATLAQPRRIEHWRDHFDWIIADEAHHIVARTWSAIVCSQSRARVLGFTATPERLDGRGLGEIFDVMVEGPSTADLIEIDRLSGFVVYEPASAPDLSAARIRAGDYASEDLHAAISGIVVESAVDEYVARCRGVPAVAFCVDRAHSKAVAEAFNAAGVRAVHLDGDTPMGERRAAIAGVASGAVEVICNCGLISEGVDVPAIGAVILLRPTQSLALYLQQVGRALRPAPNKKRASILDFAGNCACHGMPDAPSNWSLEAKPRRLRGKTPEKPRPRRCGQCWALNRPAAHQCSECDADLRSPKERAEIEMRLQETARREQEDMIACMPRREQWRWADANEDRLRIVARLNGYKSGWVFYRLQELRQEHMSPADEPVHG